MHEPFRCVGCGAPSTAATRCAWCGGRAFALARPPARAETPEEPMAELFSLQAARVQRLSRETVQRGD
ncbi:MAG TPA: hypothetical protein VGJ70_04880 [Solirubrobacteraceae bacterium]